VTEGFIHGYTFRWLTNDRQSRKVGTTYPVSDFDRALGKMVCPEKVVWGCAIFLRQ
jgi:hypothetical protein